MKKKPITFFKMVASGNDFVVVDNRKKVIKEAKLFGKKVCAAHYGIGADGVLLVEPSDKADFFMRIINPDGSEAEACGNGYRCIGLYAHEILGFERKMTFDTLSGVIELEVKTKGLNEPKIRVKTVDPTEYCEEAVLENLGERHGMKCSFINTGVPHVVIFTDGLELIDVDGLGRSIRNHRIFSPRGTNVNFVQVIGPNEISIRTYERGVEAETLACGTGTLAGAVVSCLDSRVKSPVLVKTRGGEVLKVYLKYSGEHVHDLYLEGSAEFVFEGKLLMQGD